MGPIISEIRNDARYWWLYLLNGIIFLIAGFVIFRHPFSSYLVLAIFFSITLFITGIMEIAFATSNSRSLTGWGWYLASGIIDLIIGFVLMLYPAISMAVIPIFMAFWFIFKGLSLGAFALQLRSDKVPNWGWLLAGGILLIIFAIILLDNPALGILTVLTLMATGFWMAGVLSILFAFRLRHFKKILGRV